MQALKKQIFLKSLLSTQMHVYTKFVWKNKSVGYIAHNPLPYTLKYLLCQIGLKLVKRIPRLVDEVWQAERNYCTPISLGNPAKNALFSRLMIQVVLLPAMWHAAVV